MHLTGQWGGAHSNHQGKHGSHSTVELGYVVQYKEEEEKKIKNWCIRVVEFAIYIHISKLYCKFR